MPRQSPFSEQWEIAVFLQFGSDFEIKVTETAELGVFCPKNAPNCWNVKNVKRKVLETAEMLKMLKMLNVSEPLPPQKNKKTKNF